MSATDHDEDLLEVVIRRCTPAGSECTRHPAAADARRPARYTARLVVAAERAERRIAAVRHKDSKAKGSVGG